jgi:dTDP-4-dehydrorhamnose 3,5-epimerase
MSSPACQAPKRATGPVAAAFENVRTSGEPLFLPAAVHVDDRGWSMMNQLQGVLSPEGQINFSLQFPGVIKAWHRHRQQTDFWLCVQGHIKVGVHDQDRNRSWMLVMGEKQPGVLIIPPGLWHGAATVGPVPAGLLYYVTQAYNPAAPDEERRAATSVPGFPWEVENR